MNTKRAFIRTSLVICSVLVVLLLTGQHAFATVIMVSTTADVVNPFDGECSLREAVIVANTNAALGDPRTGECPKGDDMNTDTILLQPENYLLTIGGAGEDASASGDLDVLDNTVSLDVVFDVDGGGTAKITSGVDDRVMDIHSASVEMYGIALADGNNVLDGGGLRNDQGAVVLDDSRVINSTAMTHGGGIWNNGMMTLRNGSIVGGGPGEENSADYGGGIYNLGRLTLQSSMVEGNSANTDGGGIYNRNQLTVDDSTITTNEADGNGGGIYGEAYNLDELPTAIVIQNKSSVDNNSAQGAIQGGGGMFNAGQLQVSASYFADNEATTSGGGLFSTGDATIEDGSLVDGNFAGVSGGGIFNTGTMVIDASQVSANVTPAGGGGIANFVGDMVIQNGSLIGGKPGTGDANVAGTGGGGIYNNNQLVIDASTVMGNEAMFGAGLGLEAGDLHVMNGSVIAYNMAIDVGGGMHTSNPADVLMEDSVLTRNVSGSHGDALYASPVNPDQIVVHNSCIVHNGTGPLDKVFYNANFFVPQDAADNWWGDPSGPAPYGTGERIWGLWGISAAGMEWLAAAPAFCP